MADPGLALHKALFARMQALSVPVFDAVPERTPYPYVTIDTSISGNTDFLIERNDERFIFLNVWSEVRGQEQVLSILTELDTLLHRAALTLDTGAAVSVSVERKSTQRDSDNVTFSGQMTLRVLTRH